MCFSDTDDCKSLNCRSESQFKSTTFLDHEFRNFHTVSSQQILSEFNESEDWACSLKNCSAMNLWFRHHSVFHHVKFFHYAWQLHCFVFNVCNSVYISVIKENDTWIVEHIVDYNLNSTTITINQNVRSVHQIHYNNV